MHATKEEDTFMDQYFGTYHRFDTPSKKDAALLLGADNLVGDMYDIEFVTESGQRAAWLRNRFGAKIGFFDADFSRQLSVSVARGWTVQAVLSFVAYTDRPAPGRYWGEAAVICFDPALEDAFGPFVDNLSRRLADGVRPEVELGEQGVAKVVESKGSWAPAKHVPFPEKETGTAIMKSRRKMSEKLIEQGRKGNKGCYAVSWAFLLLLVMAVLFGLKSCGVF